MLTVTVGSLKRENDSKRQDPQASSNGSEQPTHSSKDAESLNTLEFHRKSYNNLRAESANSLKQLWSCLNLLSS